MRIDRSFAKDPPPCVALLVSQDVDGALVGEVLVDQRLKTAIRDICLDETAKWIASERAARINGAPGT